MYNNNTNKKVKLNNTVIDINTVNGIKEDTSKTVNSINRNNTVNSKTVINQNNNNNQNIKDNYILSAQELRSYVLDVAADYGRLSRYELYKKAAEKYNITPHQAKQRIDHAIKTWVSDNEESKAYREGMISAMAEKIMIRALKGETTKKKGFNAVLGEYWEETTKPDLATAQRCLAMMVNMLDKDKGTKGLFDYLAVQDAQARYKAIDEKIKLIENKKDTETPQDE